MLSGALCAPKASAPPHFFGAEAPFFLACKTPQARYNVCLRKKKED